MERFVHSLVRTKAMQEVGWCAPFELGESAPHAVGFVVPVDDRGQLEDSYTCETVRGLGSSTSTTVKHPLVKVGDDSFQLKLGDRDVWFSVRPRSGKNRLLPYVGTLKHPDFASLLVEIEPEQPAALDELCEATGEFIIGCDPFQHYEGIQRKN